MFSQRFTSAKCMYFRKVSQICFRRNTSFSKFSPMWFSMLSQASCKFKSMVMQCFASFSKLSQFMLSQAFARIRKDLQMDFRRDSPRISKCESHGFSQGFAMSTFNDFAASDVTWNHRGISRDIPLQESYPYCISRDRKQLFYPDLYRDIPG